MFTPLLVMGRFILFNSDWSSGQAAHGAKKEASDALVSYAGFAKGLKL